MNNKQKVLIEAEKFIICHLISDKRNYYSHHNQLHKDLFFEPIMREVYTIYEELVKSDKEVNIITLSKRLSIDYAFNYLSDLLSNINYHSDFETNLKELTAYYKQYRIGHILIEAKAKIDSFEDPDTVLSFIQGELNSLEVKNKEPIKEMYQHINDMIHRIEDTMNNPEVITGIGTGITKFDKFSGGFHPTDLVIMAGATSQGKTSLALTFARNHATTYKTPVGFWSLEMATGQLTNRIVSHVTGISAKDLLIGKLNKDDFFKLNKNIVKISEAKIYLETTKTVELNDIISSIKRLHFQRGIQVAFVDYIQLVRVNKKGASMEEQLGDIARGLKNLAKELNITVVALSQMNRQKDHRGDPEPRISDLRGSGQIEEAADVIMFPYRPEYYGIEAFEDGTSTRGKADLIIAKGRNIGLARIRLDFIPELTLFTDERSRFETMGASF